MTPRWVKTWHNENKTLVSYVSNKKNYNLGYEFVIKKGTDIE